MAIRLTADWVVSMDGPPLRGGAVLIGDDGRIAAVGDAGSVPSSEWTPTEHVPGILLPGLINVHTHLELTGLATGTPPSDFAAWIRELRLRKAERQVEAFAEAARRGVQAAFAAGITTVADTGDSGAVLPALAELGGSGVVYAEVFGPHPAQLGESLKGLERQVASLRRYESARLRLGVSPHAPYTVSPALYRAVADFAARDRLPIAVHLAESPAETEFVTRGTGPFGEAWRARGIPALAEQVGAGALPDPMRSPVRWLDAHGVLGPRTLCIHTVQVDASDVDLLRQRGVAIAHCPRTNERHGHGSAPLSELLRAGIRVGLGTDSELSVGPLDLFAELRAARALGTLSAAEALGLATTGAARALDLDEVGRLAPGWYGDVIGITVPPGPDLGPEEAVLRAGPELVQATFIGGRPVFRRRSPA